MSSTPSPMTGTREKPERTNRARAFSSGVSRVTVIMSVRGTITSRVKVRPSSKTECSIVRSSSSICSLSDTRSTMSRRSSAASSRSSSSVRPLPRRIRAATAVTGRARTVRPRTTPERAWSTSSGWRRPSSRGESPTTRVTRSAEIATATSSTCHQRGSRSATRRVRHTAATISASTRAKETAVRAAWRSATTRSTASARRRPSCRISATAARVIRWRADSAADRSAPSAIPRTARTPSRISGTWSIIPSISGSPGRSAGAAAAGRTSPSPPPVRRGRSPAGGGCRGR